MSAERIIEFQDDLIRIRSELETAYKINGFLGRQIRLGEIVGDLQRAINDLDTKVGQAHRDDRKKAQESES